MTGSSDHVGGRGRLGFRELVEREFAFLEEEFGFKRVRESAHTLVRYESKNVYVNVVHGRWSFEIRVELGSLDSLNGRGAWRCTLDEIITTLDKQDQLPELIQASTRERVATWVPRVAAALREFGALALKADSEFLRTVHDSVSRVGAAAMERDRAAHIRRAANRAWNDRDFTKYVQVLEESGCQLTELESKKLVYAKTRQADKNK